MIAQLSRHLCLDTLQELGWRQAQHLAKLEQHADACAVAAALKQADVVPLDAGLECKRFLREATLLACLSQNLPESVFSLQPICPIFRARG